MTLDQDDVRAIVDGVVATLNKSPNDNIRIDEAKRILGLGRRAITNLVADYPELKPAGKGSHYFSRSACMRLARLRKAGA